MKSSGKYAIGLVYVQYTLIGVIFLGPVLWMVSASFKQNIDITAYPPVLVFSPTLDNYLNLFQQFPFGKYVLNSLIIASGSTLLALLVGSPAAYAIAKYKFYKLGFAALVVRMAPGVLFVIPFYIVAVNIGALTSSLLNYSALVLVHMVITLPLVVWLLIPFFEGIPEDIEDAGLVDGCSPWQVFRKISLPLALPGLAVASIISFIFSWNYFLFALTLSTDRTRPLPVIAFNFIGQGSADWGGLMAAATIISLPALVLTFFAQRWLVSGLTAGAVK